MTDNNDLRQKAEKLVLEKTSLEDIENMSPAEVKQMLHELRVHQIELEMQNEELRMAQEALDASRTRYFDLYDLAPVGYITLSEKGLILETNLTAATLLGEPRSAMVKQPISGFILKEDQDIYYRHRKILFDSGKPQECELRMVKKDGALPFWAHLTATAAEYDGRPVCRIVMINITERKRAEEELRGFKIISDNAVYGKAIADLQGNLLYVNRFFANIHGYEPDQLIGKHLSLFHNREQIEAVDRLIASMMREGHFPPTTIWHSHRDGSVFPMMMSGILIKDDYGNPQFIAASAIDMTAHHKVDESLRDSEEKHRRLFETMAQGVIYQAADGAILSANPSAERILGLSFEQMQGKTSMDPRWRMIKEDGTDVTGTDHPAMIALRSGEPVGPVVRGVFHPDKNSHVWLSITAIPLFQAGEAKPFQAYTTFENITDRKQAETYREMGREILQILNEPGDLKKSIQLTLAALKTRTGVDAVGLRLQESEDFPYFVQDGFSKDFLLTENTLLERGKDGGVCRDKDGNVRLECTCGLVISGKTDPSNPLFTQGGSCWTNDSLPLLDLPSDQDPRLHPRNNCIHQGYASVALIPVQTSDRIVGLIQLNDKRKGRFTLETIEILEGIASHVGSALMRKQAEKALRENEAKLDSILTNSTEVIWSVSWPDMQVQYVSPAFKSVYGYSVEELFEKPLLWQQSSYSEDRPLIEKAIKELCETGSAIRESRVIKKDGSMIWIHDKSHLIVDENNRPVRVDGIASDITDRKRAEEKIKTALKEKEILLQELYHRTKNNMQTIIAIMDLQSQSVKDKSVLQMFKETQGRIKTMSLVHEKLYQTKDLSKIDLKEYFMDLSHLVSSSYQGMTEKIKITTDMETTLVTIDSAIPCGLIMNELISNVYKHAFPENKSGELSVTLKKKDDEEIEFSVKDNGIGLPEGVDIRNSETLGLQIAVALAEHQLSGSLAFMNINGARFTIKFKEGPQKARV